MRGFKGEKGNPTRCEAIAVRLLMECAVVGRDSFALRTSFGPAFSPIVEGVVLVLALVVAAVSAAFGVGFAAEVLSFLVGAIVGLGIASLAMGNLASGAFHKAMVVLAAVSLSIVAVGAVGVYLRSGLPGSLAEVARWDHWWGRLASGFAFALVTETIWRALAPSWYEDSLEGAKDLAREHVRNVGVVVVVLGILVGVASLVIGFVALVGWLVVISG